MEYIYINGNSTVGIERDNEGKVISVFIDNSEHLFGPDDNNNKEEFAHQTKRNKYRKFLEHQFENLIVLSGAGSSKDAGGKLLTELWDEASKDLTEQKLNKFCELVHYLDKDDKGAYIKNLEKLLSLANAAKEYVTDKHINLNQFILKIQNLIKTQCELTLPLSSPHELFLEKITKRKVTLPRLKIFTLNYDTLFEQASKKKNFTVIDGFSFSFPRHFSGRNFDYDIVLRDKSRVKEEDNFITRVFHLYKPHGSVDWEKLQDGTIKQSEKVENALMIYPKDSKYENSYEQPFFEMMSRFHQNLRKENVLLICIGFSFSDKHIVTAIMEALTQNPSFQLMVVNKGIDTSDKFKWLFEISKKHSNIALVDERFSDFADHYPDLKSYNQDEQNKIIIVTENKTNE
ncbi:SIR2 family protein [Chitinophagaceae bacterium 26-R-25]|nr:SIR2 family protein [Chitinophagaceae bacterium 26-R-25]